MTQPARERELLEEFSELVETGRLVGRGQVILKKISALVDEVLNSGDFVAAEDPLKGRDREMTLDPHFYYVMYWRMFDRTPAALLQDFAIRVRRILAGKIFKRCGKDVVFHHDVLFNSGRNIELGDFVFVNRRVMLDDRAPIAIGAYTGLSAGVTIETHVHVHDDFEKPLIYGGRKLAPVSIGDNCLIGYNAVVNAGVKVGSRCIVAANAVVTKDVPDRTIVGGVPARKIKDITPADESVNEKILY